ncbi:MAG: T9SS type A sorting domain-containing protein [Dysgonamonadaceae bacterium]|jgi:hypothetical protein|nr:T9SS type A sorting domain-containing protein [Dysgonamonadaceae bacterium]
MKEKLLFIILLLASMGVSYAQSLSTKKSKDFRSANVLVAKDKQLDAEKVKKVNLEVKKQSLTKSAVRKTLYSKELRNGSQYQVVRMENGIVKKRLLNHSPKLQNKILNVSNPVQNGIKRVSAAENSLYKTFEEWDGTTRDWIPAGWTDLSKAELPTLSEIITVYDDTLNFTWETGKRVSTGYCGRVQYAFPYEIEDGTDTITIAPSPQDEWLISPEVAAVKAGYVFSFDLYYDPFWSRYNYETDEFTDMRTTVEALISTDNGATWTKKWDTQEYANSFSDDELWGIIFGEIPLNWLPVSIDLSEYANQNIIVAVRYINDDGESVYVDAISVDFPQPEAFYRHPTGYLISGFSPDYYSLSDLVQPINMIIGNAYTPTQWTSNTKNAESISWNFGEDIIVDEANPVLTLPYDRREAPILSVAGKENTVTYQWGVAGEQNLLQTGGDNIWNFGTSAKPDWWTFGLGNYDPRYQFAIFSDINAEDLSDIGTFTGVGNYFEKPANKFIFENFYVHCGNIKAKEGEPVKLNIYAVGADGTIERKSIASSEVYPEDFILTENGGYKYYTVPFASFKKIGQDGRLETLDYVEINTAFFVEFVNYESADIFFQGENHSTGTGYAFVTFEEGFLSMNDLTGGRFSTSVLFDMDAIFPFLYAEDNRYDAPLAGGTKNLDIITFWHPDEWWEEYPDWISLGTPVGNPTTGNVTLPVTVAALPAGISGRSANINMASFGCDLILQVKQGDADWALGISNSTLKPQAVAVARHGDDFVLSYPASATSVAVYNIAGQRVAEYELNVTGTYTLPAGNLAKGVYVLKFNGTNSAIKILK